MFKPDQRLDPKMRFIASSGYGLFLTEQEAVLLAPAPVAGKPEARQTSVVHMTLAGANEHPAVTGTEKPPGKSNYFIGNDAARWRQNIPQYARVEYAQVYPGVDLVSSAAGPPRIRFPGRTPN